MAWLISALTVWAGIMFAERLDGTMAELLVSAPPLLAHLYSLRALMALRHEKRLQPNMMAALLTLSYIPAGLLAVIILPWQHAFLIPAAGVALAIFSFGVLFPGLSPLFAYAINAKFVRPHESRRRLAIAVSLFFLGWVMAGLVAEIISSV